MKFPRHSRLLRGPFDMAPFAAVLFLLVIFLMLGALLPTPGLPLRLPVANGLPGTDRPTVAVALDAGGRLYFANQIVTEDKLKSDLTLLAREPDIGITNLLLATLPSAVPAPIKP